MENKMHVNYWKSYTSKLVNYEMFEVVEVDNYSILVMCS